MYKQLSYEEAQKLISQDQLIIADVRDEASYKKGHINKAIHFSMNKMQEFCKKTQKNQAILVYCYHGISSQSVAQHLIDQGFTEVYSLTGGYEGWMTHHSKSK